MRLVLLTKANGLARGHSGVRRPVIEALLALLQCGRLPRDSRARLGGASGDLAPLAHLRRLMGTARCACGGTLVPAPRRLARPD